MSDQPGLLSIILLSYYSEDRISKVYHKLSDLLDHHQIPFEMILMDDGSTDKSYEIARQLESEHERVRAFQLSKNYTSHYSIFAGLSVAQGACAMALVDDEQLPYETIPTMYELWRQGHKVVIPYRNTRKDPWFSRIMAGIYYRIMNRISEIEYPPGGADLCLLDREVIDIVNERIRPINTSSIAEVLRLGFDPYFIPYDRPKGDNPRSRWTFKKRVQLAMDTFFSSSSFPIKVIIRLGLFFSVVSFLMVLFYIYLKLFGNEEFWNLNVPGWTSIFIIISFFSGIIILSLGVIAEYIWRIHEEVKDRPGYIIKQKDDTNE